MAEDLMRLYNAMSVTAQQELYSFALFLYSQKNNSDVSSKKTSCFGALKDKILYISPDFDDPVEDFAEYM
ncbi:MAG: DUF2281 domain-containing protein [Spirochaetaceae bacterium]|nr:DUF2281 domain-containing protein [Spirochaetaceae bacterium]MBO4704671.1 DUF2281 domain-containing protein [Spirochaetaceae bacterium]